MGSRQSHPINLDTRKMSSGHEAGVLLFLETTVQIERIIGMQERRDTIRQNLRGRRPCTSGHVLGEFNKTLIRDAITFRELLISSPSVSEAVKRLGTYGRKFQRTVVLFATIGFDDNRQNTIDRLEKFIDWQAHDHFWESIDESDTVDEVGCVLKLWKPFQNETGDYDLTGLKCLKGDPPPCRVQQFIEDNREILEGFVVASKENTRENVGNAGEAIEGILGGTDVPFGERSNCYAIADTMIVLECPIEAEIYSTDGDVREISNILNRKLFAEKTADASQQNTPSGS